MCHNIAFWDDAQRDTLKLFTLDSDNGILVSVVASRPPNDNRGKEFERKFLWKPQVGRANSFLNPPDHDPHGSSYFGKGLAVLSSVAYFSVIHKTPTHHRRTIENSLLAAVHLPSGQELNTKKIRIHGLISQILTGECLVDCVCAWLARIKQINNQPHSYRKCSKEIIEDR